MNSKSGSGIIGQTVYELPKGEARKKWEGAKACECNRVQKNSSDVY